MRANEFQESINRRDFLGGAGAAIGLGTLGYGAVQQKKRSMSDPYGDPTSSQNEPTASATQTTKKLATASPAKPQRVIPKYTPAQLEQYLIDYVSKNLSTSQLIQFMAQAKTETHDFRSLAEYDSAAHSKYSGGQKYKGRGYLQITHDHNYEKYGQMIGQDLINDPDLLLYPNIAAKASLAYWEDYAWPTSQRLMKKFKNQFRTVTKAVTKAVNGGYKKLDERERNVLYYTNKFKKPGDGRVVRKTSK